MAKATARVNARKLSLFSLYQFLLYAMVTETSDFSFMTESSSWKWKALSWSTKYQLLLSFYEDRDWFESYLEYCQKQFFSYKNPGDVDREYCFAFRQGLLDYWHGMYDAFKWYFSKLPFESLDPLDQSVFLLGYIEAKTLRTEKKILINELIELAKRYGDSWSPRIINAVFDKWLVS